MLREFVRYLVDNNQTDLSAQAALHSQKASELFAAGDIKAAQNELNLAIEKSGWIAGQHADTQVDIVYEGIIDRLAGLGIEDIPVSRENIDKFVEYMGTFSKVTQIPASEELPYSDEITNIGKEDILRREYPHVDALLEDNQDEYLYKKALTSLMQASDGLPVSNENRQMAFYNYWKKWCEETGYKPEEKVAEGKGRPRMIKREDAINFLWYVHDVFMPRGTAYGLQKKI